MSDGDYLSGYADAERMVSDREQLAAMLYTAPLTRADAIVILCGEDAEPRTQIGFELWKGGGAPGIVVSGGLNHPPAITNAETARLTLLGKHGVAPDRILVEDRSQHTRDQAVNVLDLAVAKGWTRLLLVASHYHLPRAFLTFVRRLDELDQTETIRLIPVAVLARWTGHPDGVDTSRRALLDREYAKIETYGALGHVAGYDAGISYLSAWEDR